MNYNDDLMWFWLTGHRGIGRRTIAKLLNIAGSPKEIYNMPSDVIESLSFLRPEQKAALRDKNISKCRERLLGLADKDIIYIHPDSDIYPSRLLDIEDRPYCLYARCKRKNAFDMFDRPSVAIVGSRECTAYGYGMAYNIAKELSAYGITIISGMAKGVDGAAQRGAVESGGATCAVLGCGADICYPYSNIELYMDIMGKGILISEYPPGTKPCQGHFPERNRIISGLSDIVIVVEAGAGSGSLITIDMALEQGKDVYAVPGRLSDKSSEGCNHLIKCGAGVYTGIKDILEEFGIKNEDNTRELTVKNNFLATEEKIVYARLGLEPKHVDRIVEETNLDADKVFGILLDLELKHIIRMTEFNYYVII